VSELLDSVESLKVSLRSRDSNLGSQMLEMDRLRSENRELRRVEERLAHKERKHRDLKEKNKDLVRENEKVGEEVEVARASGIQLRQNLETCREEAKIETAALRDQYGKQMDELSAALQRENELAEQLDRYKGEATSHRQINFEAGRNKDTALADAQRAVVEYKSKAAGMELKYDKAARDVEALAVAGKEAAVTKEKLRAEGQRGRELTRRLKELEARFEEERRRREEAESGNVSLKEKARSAETDNKKLTLGMKTLTAGMKTLEDKGNREEAMFLESSKDKEAIRKAAGGEADRAKLEGQVKELRAGLKAKKAETGDLTKEVNTLMETAADLEGRLRSATEKLEEAEKARDFSLKAAKIAARASASTTAESADENKEVVGDLLVKNGRLEESLSAAEKKVTDLLAEKENYIATVIKLKQSIDAAKALKKKSAIALEKAQKDAAAARKAASTGVDASRARLLLRGSEIEREASERKAAASDGEVKRLREEIERSEMRLTGAREKFQIRLKKIESDLRNGGGEEGSAAAFGSLVAELEATSEELEAEKEVHRAKVKEMQVDLDAHVEAVPLLREMLEKFRAWGEACEGRLVENGETDVPPMPVFEQAGEDDGAGPPEGGTTDDENDGELNLSDSLSGSESLGLSTSRESSRR